MKPTDPSRWATAFHIEWESCAGFGDNADSDYGHVAINIRPLIDPENEAWCAANGWNDYPMLYHVQIWRDIALTTLRLAARLIRLIEETRITGRRPCCAGKRIDDWNPACGVDIMAEDRCVVSEPPYLQIFVGKDKRDYWMAQVATELKTIIDGDRALMEEALKETQAMNAATNVTQLRKAR